ncbi:MAG TPA: hypothetical protein DCZ10_18485 [Pelotomaculum sp.]|jgi:hypothetical protein|nr:hypothetical protein [Pelotomaculum sp.]
MEFEQRRELRDKLLKKAYDYYFEKNGSEMYVDEGKEGPETLLAYEYLKDKRLIEYIHFGGKEMKAKITSLGIDFIESGQKFNK